MEAGERFLNNVLAVDRASELQGWALRESMRAGGQVASRATGTESQYTATTASEFAPGEFGTASTNGSGGPRLAAAPAIIHEESPSDTLSAPSQSDRARNSCTFNQFFICAGAPADPAGPAASRLARNRSPARDARAAHVESARLAPVALQAVQVHVVHL